MATKIDQTQMSYDRLVEGLAHKGRGAQRLLASMPSAAKAEALIKAAAAVREDQEFILAANRQDVGAGEASGLTEAMLDRLTLDPNRLEAVASAIEQVSRLPDPVGKVIEETSQANGLEMRRVRVPIGMIGIIYESRPNVTADAAALCLRSGNAALLRGGSEAVHSNRAIHAAFARGIEAAGVPPEVIQLMPTQDRQAVGSMLRAAGLIDMIVPRGGKGLVERVQNDARVPVLAHLDGICHTYVHADADAEMARKIVVNAKMRRTGICGAMETLLIDRGFAHGAGLVGALIDAGCEVRGDDSIRALDGRVIAASDNDWDTEYLAAVASVAMVDDLDTAMAHIARHSSNHTEAIITDNHAAAERFLVEVDSAIVMHNASTQYADGGEFGLGAEIGIATGRLHARGPVALEGLTTYKWQVRGGGQARP